MINLKNIRKIYFVGIGGIAMSATAGIAKHLGYEVLGSDCKELYSPAKDVLDNYKIPYFAGYNAQNIANSKADLYVLSAGEALENPEVKYIVESNLPRVSFPELLYNFTQEKLRVVVAGTHGKSTTAGLLGHLLKEVDNGSFMTGAVLRNYESNFYVGDGHYFVFEGDEYKSEFDDPTPKFHYYKPDILVLTNLEYDHPDVFESLEALEEEFRLLIADMPDDGLIVYNADNALLTKLVRESEVSSVSFGIDNEADFHAEDIILNPEYSEFKVYNRFSKDVLGQILNATEDYKTQLPGKHNVYNALAALATLRALGFSYEQLSLEALTFLGVKRRFEVLGQKNGAVIIDDYAHHPTAITQTLEAVKAKYPLSKIWAVFEPHTFSRTQATLNELAKCFELADNVLISEIYPAREKVQPGNIKASEVVAEVAKNHKNVSLVKNKEEALSVLSKGVKEGDVIVVMAVGNFNRLAYELKESI